MDAATTTVNYVAVPLPHVQLAGAPVAMAPMKWLTAGHIVFDYLTQCHHILVQFDAPVGGTAPPTLWAAMTSVAFPATDATAAMYAFMAPRLFLNRANGYGALKITGSADPRQCSIINCYADEIGKFSQRELLDFHEALRRVVGHIPNQHGALRDTIIPTLISERHIFARVAHLPTSLLDPSLSIVGEWADACR